MRGYEPVCTHVLHEDLEVARNDAPIRIGADREIERAHGLSCSERDKIRVLRGDLGRRRSDLLVKGDGAFVRFSIVASKRVNLPPRASSEDPTWLGKIGGGHSPHLRHSCIVSHSTVFAVGQLHRAQSR